MQFVFSSLIYFVYYMIFTVVILGPLWSTFVSSLSVYEKASIEGTDR